jgi:hypothetical protein
MVVAMSEGLERDTYEHARQIGRTVVLPGPRELFVDIDSAEGYGQLWEALAMFRDLGVPLTVVRDTPSPSGAQHHRHVVVQAPSWEPLTEPTRVALQVVLGSDWKREAYSLARIRAGRRPVTAFFELPEPQPAEAPARGIMRRAWDRVTTGRGQ